MLYIQIMKCKSIHALRLVFALIAYGLGLVGLNCFYREHSAYKYWLVLLPLLPLIYMATVIIRYAGELDEMWRKVLTEAMAFSGIATGFTCFTYLFLRDMGAPEFHGEWAFYLMWAYYGIGTIVSYRRYS
jgi:hypothetical protein